MVIAIDSDRNVYIVDYYREHSPLYDMPKTIVDMAKKYHPVRRVNVEKVGAQGLVKDYVNQLVGKDRKLAPGLSQGVRPPAGIKKEDTSNQIYLEGKDSAVGESIGTDISTVEKSCNFPYIFNGCFISSLLGVILDRILSASCQ